MKATATIVKRNLLNYIYDPSSVFFSFLSVFILIGVYGIFLGTFQVQEVERAVGPIPGVDWLVTSWLIAGLLTVSSFTVPLSILSNMVIDLEKKVFDDFLVAPIKRSSIVFGYAISAIIIGIIMTSLTFLLGEITLVVFSGGEWLSALSHLEVFAWIVLANTTLAALSFFIITFVKSAASVNALNTIIGTLIGFLAGIYVPFAAFSETVSNVFKFNPAAHIVVALRSVIMEPALDFVFAGAPAGVEASYTVNYGVEMTWFSQSISMGTIALYLGALLVLFAALSILRMRSFKR